MTDLDKLIEAVEAGAWSEQWTDFTKAIGLRPDDRHVHAINAYKGSLDAAKALHDALLPGFDWCLTNDASHAGDEDGPAAMLARKGGGFEGQTQSPSPARAWLLAILKAYRETKKGGQE